MKRWNIYFGMLLAAAGLAGCTSAYQASAGYSVDDLYAIHDRVAIANRQKAEAEARQAEWEARLAEAKAAAAEAEYNRSTSYEGILADDYESAYARRLRGFESPTYRMPSSYYNFRYSSSFTYATAYDPAFYNIVIMGDQVWVEPKYITSMFGSWGRPYYYVDPWYYGWVRPWGVTIGGWGWSVGIGPWWDHDPWHTPWWGPSWAWGGWGHPHRPWWGPHGWGHYRPHNYMLRAGGRDGGGSYRYMPSRGSSGGHWSFTPGRTGTGSSGSSYNRGGGTRNGSSGSGTIRYESGGRNGSSPFRGNNGSSSGSSYNRGNNSSGNSSSGNNRGSTINRGSSSGSSFGGGSRGGSTGSFGSGGSRGGSVGGRGNGGR